ncbi:MAG TPA: PocR ligand-binding domain-containing protein [Desulfohalobiaceae bacterium]|nr:PocR ligand-binding domain-containing protein [Desulfohalobiaceae bacterium]
MLLTDLLPVEKWEELEKELFEHSGLNSCVYDTEGNRITSFKAWANDLCPLIKSYPQGVSAICAIANQFFTSEAQNTQEPVISECDAGFVKFALPIFYNQEFLGTVGGCGHCLPDGEVETFLIHKTLDIDESKLEEMAQEVKTISEEEIDKLVNFLQARLQEILPKSK